MLLAWENKSSEENNKFIENFSRETLVEKGHFKGRGDVRYVELYQFRN
jgi:hypothetical protein